MLKIEKQYVKVFTSKLEGSDKLTHKTVSVRGPKQNDGTYKSENWDGRFIGKAKAYIDGVADGTLVAISGEVHNGYVKDKGSYPYILITEAEPYNG